MTDYYNTRYAGETRLSSFMVVRYARLAATAVSAALILGAGVWGYQLLQRSLVGIPVILAPETPMREQPESPGGTQATHQGLGVNAVAAEGGAASPADQILLAPPPVRLDPEDMPAGQIKVGKQEDPLLSRQLIINAVVSQVLTDAGVGEMPETAEPSGQAGALRDSKTGAVIRSPRPHLRPDGVQLAANPALAAMPQGPVARELDVATLKPGTRLAQIGTFDSADDARVAWDKLARTFRDFLTGHDYVIQTAESGGRKIYRLRASGFAGLNEAKRFCAALSAEKAECVPVVIR